MHENKRWIAEWAVRMNNKFGPPEKRFNWTHNLVYATSDYAYLLQETISLAKAWENSKFGQTFCSQCGKWFGPGDQGFSMCKDHQGKRFNIEPEEKTP